MAKNIFITFNDCLAGRAFNPDNGFDGFMFCRYLGNSPKMIHYANFLNCYNLDDYTQYRFIQAIKNRPYSIKWIQVPKDKDNNRKETEVLYEEYMRKYNISRQKANDYLRILKLI